MEFISSSKLLVISFSLAVKLDFTKAKSLLKAAIFKYVSEDM